MKNVKKLLLSVGVTLSFIAYSWHQRGEGSSIKLGPSTKSFPSVSESEDDGVTSVSNGNPPASSGGSVPQGIIYKDGTYTGSVADAFYGNIQVEAIIKNGKIVDVQFLQYPNDRENSIAINTQAMPYLKQEAIQAQGANVNIISGATDTSQAFIQSLTDALNQAQRG